MWVIDSALHLIIIAFSCYCIIILTIKIVCSSTLYVAPSLCCSNGLYHWSSYLVSAHVIDFPHVHMIYISYNHSVYTSKFCSYSTPTHAHPFIAVCINKTIAQGNIFLQSYSQIKIVVPIPSLIILSPLRRKELFFWFMRKRGESEKLDILLFFMVSKEALATTESMAASSKSLPRNSQMRTILPRKS